MGRSITAKSSKTRLLAGVFDHVNEGQMETLEIVSNCDQMTQLMTALLEINSGQIVSLEEAFSDL